jgi:hypothetical protein
MCLEAYLKKSVYDIGECQRLQTLFSSYPNKNI